MIGVGDSFTFGTGVRAEDTFLAELERGLREKGLRAEVLNLGVPGYDAVETTALLRNFGVALEPDLIVYCFFLNDAGGGTTNRMLTPERERGFLQRSSVLWDRLTEWAARREHAQAVVDAHLESFADGSASWEHASKEVLSSTG